LHWKPSGAALVLLPLHQKPELHVSSGSVKRVLVQTLPGSQGVGVADPAGQ